MNKNPFGCFCEIMLEYFSGLIWCLPLAYCILSNIILNSKHIKHITENENKNDEDGFILTPQEIKKDWFILKECLLFAPFITVNVGLFMTYIVLYYLSIKASRTVVPSSSPHKETELYEM